jgi:hypothetical protein
MFRRYTSLLVVWFGLLSVVAPALTCAAAVQQGDCCPIEGPAPCGECPERRAPSVPDQGHCVAPIVQAVAATAVSTVVAEQASYPDAPDFAAPFNPPSLASQQHVGPALSPEPAASVASTAAFTYLVTGRLRL